MDKIRVGFVGVGQIAELHARGYVDNPTGQLVALSDSNAELLAARADEWGVDTVYADYNELLEDPDVDAVEILLPHHLHLPATLAALAAGKHVSLQKPMTRTQVEADEMVKATDASSCLFRVFENFRTYEPYQRAKQMILNGEIGDTLSIRVKTIHGRGVGGWVQPEEARAWRYDPETGGGPPAIIDHGYHLTSAIVYFLGPVERVHAMVDTREAGTSRYSGSPAMITWKHTQGERYGSWEIVDAPDLLIRTGYYSADEWVEITGTRGILWVTRCSGDLLGEAPIILCRDGEVRRYHDMAVDWGDSFVRGAHEFTRAIQGGYQPDLDAREARHVLAFSLAAMKSGLERCEVSVEP